MKFQLKVMFAFAAIYLIWGSTYLAILYVTRDMPPILMSGLRFLLAGLILLVWCIVKGEKLPERSSVIKNAICGILMLLGGTGAVAWSEQYISSSVAAIIVTTVPFWFVLLDREQWSFYLSNKTIIPGMLLGFAGVLLLLYFNSSGGNTTTHNGKFLLGIIVIILGGIAWTTGSLYSKYRPTGDSLLMNGSVQMLVAGAFSLLITVVTGESRHFHFTQVGPAAWYAFFYLVVAGSLVTYVCYLWLLKVKPAAQVSSYVYVNPVVATILGGLIAGEQITPIQRVSLLLILLGVWLVNLPKYKFASKSNLSTT